MRKDSIKLVAFDMEGCLTTDPTVWEIMHRRLGTWESHGLPYWNRYRAGEFAYDEFARMDVAVWHGAPLAMLMEAADEVPLSRGCAELMAALSSAGIGAAVITNGLTCVAERFRRRFSVQHIFANHAVSRGQNLTGEIEIRVPYHDKGRILQALADNLGLNRRNVAAVGDSLADTAMFRVARLGIAVRPSDRAVAEAATHVVKDDDLRALLPLLMP
jgi:phosphoserine phosphatase